MKNGTCPKCGSNEILTELTPVISTHTLHVEIAQPKPPEKPSILWLPDSVESDFKLYICGACGYTELYATKYKELNEGWEKGYRNYP